MALTPRSWPTVPSSGVTSSVVSKSKVLGPPSLRSCATGTASGCRSTVSPSPVPYCRPVAQTWYHGDGEIVTYPSARRYVSPQGARCQARRLVPASALTADVEPGGLGHGHGGHHAGLGGGGNHQIGGRRP